MNQWVLISSTWTFHWNTLFWREYVRAQTCFTGEDNKSWKFIISPNLKFFKLNTEAVKAGFKAGFKAESISRCHITYAYVYKPGHAVWCVRILLIKDNAYHPSAGLVNLPEESLWCFNHSANTVNHRISCRARINVLWSF